MPTRPRSSSRALLTASLSRNDKAWIFMYSRAISREFSSVPSPFLLISSSISLMMRATNGFTCFMLTEYSSFIFTCAGLNSNSWLFNLLAHFQQSRNKSIFYYIIVYCMCQHKSLFFLVKFYYFYLLYFNL